MPYRLLDLTSPGAVTAYRAGLEADLDRRMERFLDEFVSGVIADATDALSSPTLLAAGTPSRDDLGRFVADPFSFTQVQKRWYAAVREMADSLDGLELSPDETYNLLERSDLPTQLYDDVVEILLKARSEGWTSYRTRRHLSRTLIPKQSSGRWTNRAQYRASVRTMARTLATQNTNARAER